VTDIDVEEPWTPRSARLGDREHDILQATYSLLAEVGYAGLRFDAVAARARASKATLYRHWPGKAQLVADAVRVCAVSPHDMPDTGTLRGDLHAFLSMMAASIGGESGKLFAGLILAMDNDAEFAAEMRALQATKRANTSVILERAVARGELSASTRPGLIEEIAPAVMFMHRYAEGAALDSTFIDHLVDDILLPLLHR
jgi:AcrR family transcriptional regulator